MMMIIMMKRRDSSGKFLLNIHYFNLNIQHNLTFEHKRDHHSLSLFCT
jgi:hypothetical protein